MQLMASKSQPKLQYEFMIPLPETLPSTFLYHGSRMSQLAVLYEFKAQLIGLKS